MTSPIATSSSTASVRLDFSRDLHGTADVLSADAKLALLALKHGADTWELQGSKALDKWFVDYFGVMSNITPPQALKLAGQLQAMNMGWTMQVFAGSLAAYGNAYTDVARLLAVVDFDPKRTQKCIVDWARNSFGESDAHEVGNGRAMSSANADALLGVLRSVQNDRRFIIDDATRATLDTLARQATVIRATHRLIQVSDVTDNDWVVKELFASFGGVEAMTAQDASNALKLLGALPARGVGFSGAVKVAHELAYTASCLLDPSLHRRPSDVPGWQQFFERGFGKRLVAAVGLPRATELTAELLSKKDPKQLPLIRKGASRAQVAS